MEFRGEYFLMGEKHSRNYQKFVENIGVDPSEKVILMSVTRYNVLTPFEIVSLPSAYMIKRVEPSFFSKFSFLKKRRNPCQILLLILSE